MKFGQAAKFHARIRDVYNPILRTVAEEYASNGSLPNAYYVDVFDVQFSATHVNRGDCFHPSREGQALLADAQWSGVRLPSKPERNVLLPIIIPFLLD